MLKDLCFEIIQTCPNKCKFCSSNSSQDKKTIITLEQFKKTVIHFINKGGIEEISISGGEPFLHPDLFKMISFCKEKGIRTVIFTSGITVAKKISDEEIAYIQRRCENDLRKIEENEPWNERMKRNIRRNYEDLLKQEEFGSISKEDLEKLKQLKIDKIVFDWQALDEKIDSDLMGRENISFTYLIQSLIRARKVGLNVDVHFIPMKPNFRQFPDIIECLEIAEIRNISILNFVPQGRGYENKRELMLNEGELKEFSEILQKEKAHYKGSIRIGIPLNGRMSHLCTAGTEKLDIKYDGTILPCPAFKELNLETMKKYGIRLYNIYEDLENLVIHNGKRKEPLCKKVYGFNVDLTPNEEHEKDL